MRATDYDQKVCIAGEDPGRRSKIERKDGTGFEKNQVIFSIINRKGLPLYEVSLLL